MIIISGIKPAGRTLSQSFLWASAEIMLSVDSVQKFHIVQHVSQLGIHI
jgi:hypothetical protein